MKRRVKRKERNIVVLIRLCCVLFAVQLESSLDNALVAKGALLSCFDLTRDGMVG